MLTEEQEKRLTFLEERIQRDREEQRVLYAIRDGVYITDGEKTAQVERASRIPEPKETKEIRAGAVK